MNTRRTPDIDDLKPDQRERLLQFRAQYGRYWKYELNHIWQNGRDADQPGGSLLRQIRNQFGPTWLDKLRID